jgi:glutamyl-Q tRNA(Asp) synthetase
MGASYRGRFAPSPTGPLHAGSLLAALASWLDARAHQGQWLLRIEDVDRQRCLPGLDRIILRQLGDCGLHPDLPPVWQSQRSALYQQALERLIANAMAYPCRCSRAELLAARGPAAVARQAELIYPGTCRQADPQALVGRRTSTPAWRVRTDGTTPLHWNDRRLGTQQQNVEREVGDFVLKRADGCYSYQLAVVVDDAEQGISDVVRGEDLCSNTARQLFLQQCLGLPHPRYLHTPLVMGVNGEKLSKQNGAQAIDTTEPLKALNQAALALGLPPQSGGLTDALGNWVLAWGLLFKNYPRTPLLRDF